VQLPQSFTDPWAEILTLIPAKITYKGAPVQGDANTLKGFAGWLMQAMPAIVGTGDPDTKAGAFLLWLRSEKTYEADDQTRMSQKAQPLPPANPISDQTLAQVAQHAPPAAAPAPAPAAVGAPAAEAEEGTKMRCPECQQEISGLRGLKRHVTMTHKAEWPAFCAAHGLDQKTGLRGGAAPAAAPVVAGAPPPPPPAPAVAPMFGAQPGSVTNPPTFTPPPPPPIPAHPTTMPEPAAVVPPGHTPFVAPAVVPPASPPAVAFTPQNEVVQDFKAAGYTQTPNPAPPPAPTPGGAPTREVLANMLGGPVHLTVVRLLDAAQVDLNGKVDVNQLAALAAAKAKAEMKVMDLAQSQYGQGKQAAQRHFADLLTQAPNVYLLLNGYDPILPDGYLEILSSRVVRFHMVQDSGRTIVTIF
jgi:hypothetical protein